MKKLATLIITVIMTINLSQAGSFFVSAYKVGSETIVYTSNPYGYGSSGTYATNYTGKFQLGADAYYTGANVYPIYAGSTVRVYSQYESSRSVYAIGNTRTSDSAQFTTNAIGNIEYSVSVNCPGDGFTSFASVTVTW
jgi:hypothetical protein